MNARYKDSLSLVDTLGLTIQEALIELQVLEMHAVGATWIELIKNPGLIQETANRSRYKRYLKQRLSGMPIPYIVGHKEFYGLNFFVNEHVLCPRQDTEVLVDSAIEIIKKYRLNTILELGTGCGAISVAIAKNEGGVHITALDISEEAIEVTKKNVRRANVEASVEVISSNWFSNVTNTYDLIISNPPYIAEGDIHLNDKTLLHEPKIALVSGVDGLDAIREIIVNSSRKLTRGGWLLFEHGHDQGLRCRDLLREADFSNVFTQVDLSGNERVSGGTILL